MITAVVCLALAAVVAAMASLNVALPDIARDTHATQTELTWVIDAYSLAFASLLLPGGALGDRYGRRVALIVGLVIFGAGSAVAMTATSATELIALRAVLGLGAALVMPATLSTITSTFPAAERTRAVSIWAAVGGGAAILGLLASGAPARGVLVAVDLRPERRARSVALAGTLRFVPESADPDAPRLDVGGAAIAVVALVALVFSVIEAPTYGWLAARTLGRARCLVFGDRVRRLGAAPAPPAARPARVPQPHADHREHVDLRPVLRVLRLHLHRHAVPPARPRGDTRCSPRSRCCRWPPRWCPPPGSRPGSPPATARAAVCAGGLVLVAAGLAIIAQRGTDTPYALMAAGLVVLGIGMGAAMTPATSAITEALPPAQQGVGSALNDLSREVGGATGIAVIGSILTSTYSSHVDVNGLPSQVAAEVKGSYAVAAHLRRRSRPGARGVRHRDAHRAAHGRRRRAPRGGHRGRAAADAASRRLTRRRRPRLQPGSAVSR